MPYICSDITPMGPVAIGGINKNNVGEVVAAGVRHIAMITALTEAPDVERATRNFLSLLQ